MLALREIADGIINEGNINEIDKNDPMDEFAEEEELRFPPHE